MDFFLILSVQVRLSATSLSEVALKVWQAPCTLSASVGPASQTELSASAALLLCVLWLVTKCPTNVLYTNCPTQISPGYLWPVASSEEDNADGIIEMTPGAGVISISPIMCSPSRSCDEPTVVEPSGPEGREYRAAWNPTPHGAHRDGTLELTAIDNNPHRIGVLRLPREARGGEFNTSGIYFGADVTLVLQGAEGSDGLPVTYQGAVGSLGVTRPFARSDRRGSRTTPPMNRGGLQPAGFLFGEWEDDMLQSGKIYAGANKAQAQKHRPAGEILLENALECEVCLVTRGGARQVALPR